VADILCKTCGHYYLRHGKDRCNARNCTCRGYIPGKRDAQFRVKGEGFKHRETRKYKGDGKDK